VNLVETIGDPLDGHRLGNRASEATALDAWASRTTDTAFRTAVCLRHGFCALENPRPRVPSTRAFLLPECPEGPGFSTSAYMGEGNKPIGRPCGQRLRYSITNLPYIHMPADRERNETGQFVVQRDSEDLLESMAPGEPHTASELAEVLGWPRRSVFDRLATLHEDDRIDKKQVNARTVIWTRPEQDDQP
jgi:hypothetical protein